MINKILRPRTHKEKIFSGFLAYSLMSFLLAVLNFFAFREIEDVDKAVEKLNELRYLSQLTKGYGQEFLAYETTHASFHKYGRSPILTEHFKALKATKDLSVEIQGSKGKWKLVFKEELVRFDSLFSQYEDAYSNMIKNIKYKGFADYGLLGQMKRNAIELENSPFVDRLSVFELRQHEKEYLLSGDTTYLYKARTISHDIRDQIDSNTKIPWKDLRRPRGLVRAYNYTFLKIVEMDLRIGYKNRKGLALEIEQLMKGINNEVETINHEASVRKDELYMRVRFAVVTIAVISVTLLLILSLSLKLIMDEDDE